MAVFILNRNLGWRKIIERDDGDEDQEGLKGTVERKERQERYEERIPSGYEGTRRSEDDEYVAYGNDGAGNRTVCGVQNLELKLVTWIKKNINKQWFGRNIVWSTINLETIIEYFHLEAF